MKTKSHVKSGISRPFGRGGMKVKSGLKAGQQYIQKPSH